MAKKKRTSDRQKPDIENVKQKHEGRLMGIEGVQGVGVGEVAGRPVIRVYVDRKTDAVRKKIPERLDGHPVVVEASGEFHAQTG